MVDNTFNENLYDKLTFPHRLFAGINLQNGNRITTLKSEKELKSIMDQFNNQMFSEHSSFSTYLALDFQLEKELVLLTHTYEGCQNYVGDIQRSLADFRQKRAYLQCQVSQQQVTAGKIPSIPYHHLAFLYYTLMHGQSSLGHYMTAQKSYVAPLQELKSEGITSPKVLLLGFSSIFSLENLAAMLHLVGFKQSTIVALDKSEHPLEAGTSYSGKKLFSSDIEYVQQDILADKLDSKIALNSFDFIATHLFFTHFQGAQKKYVWERISQLLSPQGIFADEEIVVNGRIDRQAYNNYFKTLAGDYKHSDNRFTRQSIEHFMYIFGSTGPFNPYNTTHNILNDAQMELNMPFLCSRNIWAAGGGIITADMHAIHAKK